MKRSTYTQPLPKNWLQDAAAGVLPNGDAVPGKRHTYPEMAAAGLWTTAEDLALFAIEIQKALKGESKLLSQTMARTMIDLIDGDYALGLGIKHLGNGSYFGHGGWDEGFSADLSAHIDKGYGVVIMINSNHPAFINELTRAVAYTYGWDGYKIREKQQISKSALEQNPGRYKYNAELSITVYTENDHLFMPYTGEKAQE